jgi:signal transduction histidine kinase
MINRHILLILTILFLSSNTYAASRDNLDKLILQLKWFHQFQFAGYYAAIEKGIYQEVGLDVVLKEGKPGISTVDEVLSGRADYGIGMSSLIVDRNQGDPVVLVASIFQHSPEILIFKKEAKLTSLHELKGQRIMLRPSGNIAIRGMFINEGINLEEINILPHTWNVDDLINNKVSAISAYSTNEPFILEQRGFPFTIVNPLTYGIDFYGDCLFTSEIEIKNNPDRVKAFRKATLQGWEYALRNPEEMVDLLLTKYESKKTREQLLFEAQELNENIIMPEYIEIGHTNPGRWKHIAETYTQLGVVAEGTIKDFIYNPDTISDHKYIRLLLKIFIAIGLLTGVGLIVLYAFNRKLSNDVKKQTSALTFEINERKQAEEERERLNVELSKKNKELEQIVYVTSHDLRTPLVNIDGYNKEIGRLLKELGLVLESNGVSAEVKEKIDVIVGKNIPQAENYITTSVLKMDALLSGLLQISRLGRFEINKEELDMNETVSEILETINYQVEKAGVKMEISELPSCIGDKNQINQLFSNIIGNALKYLDSNRNGVISVSGKKEGDYSVYCVADNGIGILPDHQEKIFEIFYQLTPEKSIGEGLGLTIVKKIIDIHHGKIWVDSEPNKGSKFYISLPS